MIALCDIESSEKLGYFLDVECEKAEKPCIIMSYVA